MSLSSFGIEDYFVDNLLGHFDEVIMTGAFMKRNFSSDKGVKGTFMN